MCKVGTDAPSFGEKCGPVPFKAGLRRIVERTNSWHNVHKKLGWCTEKRGRVIDSWVDFSDVVTIVGRLIREGRSRYRWKVDLPDDRDQSMGALSAGSQDSYLEGTYLHGSHRRPRVESETRQGGRFQVRDDPWRVGISHDAHPRLDTHQHDGGGVSEAQP